MAKNLYTIYDSSHDAHVLFDAPTVITCICSYGNLIFIGTVDGRLLQLVFVEIEEQITCYSFSVIISRQLSNQSFTELRASQICEVIVALSGTRLHFLDSEKLEHSKLLPDLENVSTFSLVDNNSSTEKHTILAVANLSHTLQVYQGAGRCLDLIYTINIPSRALLALCLENYAVIATTTSYFCIELKTRKCNEIFDRSANRGAPLIASVSENEFLLAGPDSLGVFVNTRGESERPPLTLSSNLSGLFCRNEVVFAVDDEFVSIHCAKQQKQLQTLCTRGAGLACISLNRDMILLTSPSCDYPSLRVLRPEAWDLVASRLILAGCPSDAAELIDHEYAKLLHICVERPVTSSGNKNIFIARSKRVYTLMGFYYFESGQLETCRKFFEKSSLDIRELLYRFVDLLPRGYAFKPNPNLNIAGLSKASPEWSTSVNNTATPCTIFDLSDTTGVPVHRFRLFLLEYLVENRHGLVFSNNIQFVETALVKLVVQLYEHCSSIGNGAYETWDQLVNSLSNIDVQDLLSFLDDNCAPHVKALVCRWNGDIEGALDVWRSLALSTENDVSFPGPDFYADALYTALVKPLAFRGQTESVDPPASQVGTAVTGNTLYAELISRHLDQLLLSDVNGGGAGEVIAGALLRRLARITVWTGTSTGSSSSSPTFVFAAPAVLRRLLPGHPKLAEQYLWARIFQSGDKDPSHHSLLAEVQLDLLLKFIEEDKPEGLKEQRSRFRRTLSELEDCPPEALLNKIESAPSSNLLTEEYVILLGKLNKYEEALKLLVVEKQDLKSALRFCAWCVHLQERRRLTEQRVLWLRTSEVPDSETRWQYCRPVSQTPSTDAYTVLLRLLLSSKDADLTKHASQLLDTELPQLHFTEICQLLPDDWTLSRELVSFLSRAVASSIDRAGTSDVEMGLTARLAAVSRVSASTATLNRQQGLAVSEESMCRRCRRPLAAFGPQRPFAWLLQTTDTDDDSMRPTTTPMVAHLHCLPSLSNL